VAGNIVAPSQIGSVEFAAARFGTRLVVVLGHTECGAVSATLEELQKPSEIQSRNLRAIVDRVRPSVEGLLATDLQRDPEALMAHAVRANIRWSANRLLIVGAEYSLQSGLVEFFDGQGESWK
jgi:carbonic anhydrase